MPLDKDPLVVKEFMGELLSDVMFQSGETGEDKWRQSEIPFSYALNSENLIYLKKGGMRTRDGFEKLLDLHILLPTMTGTVQQFWKIENLNGIAQSNRWLILTWDNTNGRLYDTQVAGPATNPVMTLAGMKYAFVLNAFGRMYICPWSAWATPLNYVWLYNGLYNARQAQSGGAALPAGMGVAAAAGGACTPGLHILSVQYEYDTGYRTVLYGATTYNVTTTAANATINLTTIPTGPTGVIRRHIVMTKIVVNNDGRGFLSYEPFVALTINDNTTVAGSISLPDSGLVDSAKYYTTVDNIGVIIYSCISLATFGNRLVYISLRPATAANQYVLISPPNLPEQVSDAYGNSVNAINIAPEFSGKPMIGQELNGLLYIFKEDSTFSITADDGLDPIEWKQPILVDGGKGAFPFGVARIGNNPGAYNDGSLLIAGNHGISFFNGVFTQNSLADSIWERFSITELKWLKLLIEPIRKMIFFKVGDPALAVDTISGPRNKVYFASYYYGFDKLRWGKYVLPKDGADQIFAYDIDLRPPGGGTFGEYNALHSLLTILHYESTTPRKRIYSEHIAGGDFTISGGGSDPAWKYETGYTPNEHGEVYTFGPMKLRINDRRSGSVVVVKKGVIDNSTLTTVCSLDVATDPGRFYSVNINERVEQMRVELSGQNLIFIQSLVLYRTIHGLDRTRA